MAKWTTFLFALALLAFVLWYNADSRMRADAAIRPRVVATAAADSEAATVSLVGGGKALSRRFERAPSLIVAITTLANGAVLNSTDLVSVSRVKGLDRQVVLRLPLDSLWVGAFGNVALKNDDVITLAAPRQRDYRWGYSGIELLVALWAVLLSIDKGVAALLGGWAAVGERLNLRTTRPKDIRDLKLIVLATVPSIAESDRARITPRESPQLVALTSNNPGSEPFRRLRQILSRNWVGPRGPRILMVTSPQQGDGKSTIALNLARAFAYGGKSVLLVDVDCWKPTVHTTFDVPSSPGLFDFLTGSRTFDEVVRRSNEAACSVSFVTAGEAPKTAIEVLESDAFASWVDEIRGRWDVVILDTPPVLHIAAAEAMMRRIDQPLLVVSSRGSDRHSVQRAADMLRAADDKQVGVILNRFSSVVGSYFDWFATGRQTGYAMGVPFPAPITRYAPATRPPRDEPRTAGRSGPA